ncbi:hypothetical protein L2E82_06490 [Cichorium intybus]|uniref:Uncharacterized protein n=1 Tax=Cichorium intybus TaxID=13427 RepID=A0ACB9HA65_CICIN|nr:hypothetical protein L2E82_06490 [Cichorium intybus]
MDNDMKSLRGTALLDRDVGSHKCRYFILTPHDNNITRVGGSKTSTCTQALLSGSTTAVSHRLTSGKVIIEAVDKP